MISDKLNSSKPRNIFRGAAISISLLLTLVCIRTKSYSGDPLSFIIPNFMLYLPIDPDLKRRAWRYFVRYDDLPIIKEQEVPIIYPQADGRLDFDALRIATKNFRNPAVVRGLFLNTTATEKWPQKGYLAGKIGQFRISVIQKGQHNAKGGQTNRQVELFGDAINHVLENENSRKYLFFPVRSRTHWDDYNETETKNLIKETNILTHDDLDLESKLWRNYGNQDVHKRFFGGQMIAGRGYNDGKSDLIRSKNTTGTNWHCAAGNNWFVQVVGRKRWYFLDQKYSSWMRPIRNGKNSMATGDDMLENQKHFPVQFVDLSAGDMLYNPDWMWHRIENYVGLNIACPLREVNITLSFRNNLQFTTVVLVNKLYKKVFGKAGEAMAADY